jgi:hypothetical protein
MMVAQGLDFIRSSFLTSCEYFVCNYAVELRVAALLTWSILLVRISRTEAVTERSLDEQV